MITRLDHDPKFYYGHYPEHGTTGYDGPGWYVIDYRGLVGPFDSEQEAKDREDKPTDIDGWENEGGS
jgi:hypothetical protein